MSQQPTAHPSADQYWMSRALDLARQSLYISSPNPRVGCVVVRHGQILASGFTQAAGSDHAEAMAIRQARSQQVNLAGSTFYVTLEPCSHYGRTPPCVDAIIAAHPARVVVALADPNPQVGGQGLAKLRTAGIEVSVGVGADEALAINRGFVSRMVRGRPWVWLKTAASLDGGTALPDGRSQWITGAQARADGHHWRARSCVVLSGIGTVLADNPTLNVREVATPRQPVCAIVDTDLAIAHDARVFQSGSRVLVFTTNTSAERAHRLQQANAQVVVLPSHKGRVCLSALMQWLAQNEFNEVHVEAGAVLGGALMQQGLVDELLVYLAPAVLGQAMPMYQLPALSSLADAHRFEFLDVKKLGADLRLQARNPASWSGLKQATCLAGPA